MPTQELAPPNPEERFAYEPLPPVPEGHIRLYRGDVVDEAREPIIRHIDGRRTKQETEGRWFTDNPNAAEGYGLGRHYDLEQHHDQDSTNIRLRFVDVPEEVAHEFNTRNLPLAYMSEANGTGGDASEWLLPPEAIEQAQEYGVEEVEELYEPEVEEGLQELLKNPELQSYLKEMNIDEARAQEILQSPVDMVMVIQQLAIGLGQKHFNVADPEAMQEQLHSLALGVDSAHKRRYLGRHITQPQKTLNNDDMPSSTDEDMW